MEISGVQVTVDPSKAKRVAILRNVTSLNNNKFYHMYDMGDGTMICEWGRIGGHLTKKSYPISDWDKIYKKKTDGSRGDEGTYTDVTEVSLSANPIVVTTTTKSDKSDLDNSTLPPQIQSIMNDLMSYSKQSIQTNYTVSVEAVNELQVVRAQELIDEISRNLKVGFGTKDVNDYLVKLYQIIPRKMSNVRNYLLSDSSSKLDKSSLDRAERLLANEQSTLDVMRQAVSQYKKQQQKTNTDTTKAPKTILDMLGITMRDVDQKEIAMIKRLLGNNANQFRRAFKVDHMKTGPRFKNFVDNRPNKSVKLFWHGSRNENWMSILETGLVLRPANAVITGKMLGTGLYFADKAQKSIGYTSLKGSYWANGNNNKAYLALFNVHTGVYLHTKKHEDWMYDLNWNNLQKRGNYDSVFFEGGVDLKNNEYVVYNENQCTIEYIVEIS
jgi:poly [ADP-ribose] polymerase